VHNSKQAFWLIPLAVKAPFALIIPVVFVGYLCSPQTPEIDEGVGVANTAEDWVAETAGDEVMDSTEDEITEIIEDKTTVSDGEGLMETADDVVAESSLLDGVEETSEFAEDETAREKLEDAACGCGKQLFSYSRTATLGLRRSTSETGIVYR
jgi:hypothetical protein